MLVCAVLAVVVVGAGVFAVRQMFPTAGTVGDAVGCIGMRVLVVNGDAIVERGNGTPAQKAEMRRGIEQLRARYERECGPLQ